MYFKMNLTNILVIVLAIVTVLLITSKKVERFVITTSDPVLQGPGSDINPMAQVGNFLTNVQSGEDPFHCDLIYQDILSNPEGNDNSQELDPRWAKYYNCQALKRKYLSAFTKTFAGVPG
jgi:hypothetical protein